MQDRPVYSLLQTRLQTASVAEYRVSVSQMHAMQMNVQGSSLTSAKMRGQVDNVRQQLDMDVSCVVRIDNGSAGPDQVRKRGGGGGVQN